MKNIFNRVLQAFLCGLLVLLAACGGGGGGGSGSGGSSPSTGNNSLSGLAATGAAIANGAVTAHCISGPEINGVTNANGLFNLQLTPAHSLPCLLRVTGGVPTVTLYSFSSTTGQVNISPVTDLIVTRALGTSPIAVFGSFNSTHAGLIGGALSAAKTYVLAQVEAVTGDRLRQDPISGSFVVGDSDDKVLDALGGALAAAGKTIVDLRIVASTGGDISSTVPQVSVLGAPREFLPSTLPLHSSEPSIAALLSDNSTLIFDSYGADGQAIPITLLRLSTTGAILETVQVANGPSALYPQVQSDGIGGAFIAWRQLELVSGNPGTGEYRTYVHVRRYEIGTGLGADVKLDTGIDGNDLRFNLAVRSDGSAMIAWVHQPVQLSPRGGRQEAVFVSEYRAGAGWSAGYQLSPLFDNELRQVNLATSPNGNSMVLWAEQTPVVISPDSPATALVFGKLVARYKASGGVWQNSIVVEDDRSAWGDSLRFSDIQLSIGNSGNAMAIFQAGSPMRRDGQYGVKFNRFQAGIGWLGTSLISRPGFSPLLTMNSNGQGFVCWSEYGTGPYDPEKLYAVRFDESGFQGAVARVDQDTPIYSGGTVKDVLIDDAGNAVAIFSSSKNRAAADEALVIRVSQYTVSDGWSANSVLPPYIAPAIFSSATKVSGGKATVVWSAGGRSMMLNFTVAKP